MSQILNKVRDVDPNDSDAVKESLTAFFQNLSKHKGIDCSRWLRTLEHAINRFPKYCGQHRVTIENYLCHFLDYNNYYNVIEAAKCAHAIQQVRPQQERTASAKSCWRDQMSALCEAAHTVVDALFMKNTNIYNRNGKIQKRDSQSLSSPLQQALVDIDVVTNPNDVANKIVVLCTRLKNILIFIQAMLVEIYPVAKPVRPQLILEVLLHALGASGNEDSTTVTTVKIQALRTLDAIVACLGSNLIPFSALVFRFAMQTLKWSSENSSEETRKVRCVAYGSLTKWLNALHAHRDDSARTWDAELTSHIVADVTPPRHVIQLTPNAQPMKNLSKKARKKLANSLLMQSNISSHMPGEKNKMSISEESNDELAIAALECAEAFLTTCGIFLKPSIHKQFQELLVRECYTLDRYSGARGSRLLRALEACRRGGSSRVPPPTQYCLHLYSTLINSSQTEISKFASQALLDIRLHLHCSPPSLNFAIEPEKNNRDDKRKRVSDRNRAVLESLLGQERMPSEDLAEQEIITIPDEPMSKKSRIEENSDQISLSSESGASIEITDSSSVEEVEELDDSADYIIEPNAEMEKELQENEQNSEDLINAVVELEDNDVSNKQIDETDGLNEENGEDMVKDDDDTDTLKLTQADPKISSLDNTSQDNTQTQDISSQDNTQTQDNSSQDNMIFDAKTQLPHVSIDSNEENRSPTTSELSLEVVYDYPNTGQEKVKVLEVMDVDNLPSTNETDDQITCGQAVKSSLEEKVAEIDDVPKENGIEKSPERIVQNGDAKDDEVEGIASKIAPNKAAITVEDMLADFVDEVNDESQTQISS